MDADPAEPFEKPEGDWRLHEYEESLQQGAFVCFMMVAACLLMITGWNVCSVILLPFVLLAFYARILGDLMFREKCPPFETESKRYYMKVTSVHGIGVERLAEFYARNPEAYSVVLKDGWVNKDNAGYFTDSEHKRKGLKGTGFQWRHISETHYIAAPIYKDAASASGVPYAWAVAKNVGHEPNDFEPTYCEGAGVCGVLVGHVSDPGEGSIFSLFDASHLDSRGWFRAAENAARRGGFSYPEGLPALEMKEVVEMVKEAKEGYSKFPFYLLGFLIFCIIGDLDSFVFLRWYLKVEGVPQEQQPLVPEDMKHEGFYVLRSRMVAAERKFEIEKKKWLTSDIKAAEQVLQEAKVAFLAQAASEGDHVRCVIDDGGMKQGQYGIVTGAEIPGRDFPLLGQCAGVVIAPSWTCGRAAVEIEDGHGHIIGLKNLAVLSKAAPLGIGDRVKATVALEKFCKARGEKFKCSPGDMGTVGSAKSSSGMFDVTWDEHKQQPAQVARHHVDIVHKATAMDLPAN